MTPRRVATLAIALIVLVLFALYNRGQPVTLTFGIWRWNVDAIVAVYMGAGVGMVVMFLICLVVDMAAGNRRD